jgi:hypothetical protein
MYSCCCDPATASGGIDAHGEGKDLSFFPSDPLILLSMDGSRTVNMPGSGIVVEPTAYSCLIDTLD